MGCRMAAARQLYSNALGAQAFRCRDLARVLSCPCPRFGGGAGAFPGLAALWDEVHNHFWSTYRPPAEGVAATSGRQAR